jgi:hypothetical protein
MPQLQHREYKLSLIGDSLIIGVAVIMAHVDVRHVIRIEHRLFNER